MKTLLYTILIITLIATACKNNSSPADSAIISNDARHDDVVTDTKGADTLPHMDTTQLVVDSVVHIAVNGTPLSKSHNAVYRALYDNWLQAYTEVHHLSAVVHMTCIGTITMGIRENIMDEIVKAQDNMKQYIASDKYSKQYDSLSPVQQSEMQQQHGILFQKEFR